MSATHTTCASALSAEFIAQTDAIVARYPASLRSASLPLLHHWQEAFGCVGEDGVEWIAGRLQLEPIQILELVTFYPMLRQHPAGRVQFKVCRTLSCQMRGSAALADQLKARCGIAQEDPHGLAVSEDGKFSVEFVECLAACHNAPVVLVNEAFHKNVTPERAAELADKARTNPTADFLGDAPIARPTHPLEHRLILKSVDTSGYTVDLDCYLRHGGYEQLKKALGMAPEAIVTEVKTSGLRGRGGAGFSCGVKWGFIDHAKNTKPVYLICNADESEPGTFKDRQIIYKDPHQLLEGMIISAFANRAHLAYIYIRGEFVEGAKILERALAEARKQNFLGKNILGTGYDLEIYVHRGAGAYICGEETGLIESLEGKRAYPRIKPPYFPAVLGLYQCPTIVNNVETLCAVKHIIELGGASYAKLGRPGNTGTRILCVSGDVQQPGYYEIEVGAVTLGQLVHEMCGGPLAGRKIKAIIPGGSSAKVLAAHERFRWKVKQADGSATDHEGSWEDLPLDFDALAAAGSMAGSGGVIILDDSRDMVAALENIAAFYAHESCGQCTPCREGSLWMHKVLRRMTSGEGRGAQDAKLLHNIADNIAGRTICAFGEACAWPVQSFTEKFPEEFAAKSSAK